jgi:anti-sigma regulatory factor (Ser/Thr protein kinase)
MKKQEKENIETICINAATDELVKVRTLVEEFTEGLGFSDEKSYNIQLVVDEICTNIIKHSYTKLYTDKPEKRKSLQICLELLKKDSGLLIRIIDQGPPFNPIEFQSPNIKEHIAHPHKGGLGIPLVKLLSDKISYKILDEIPMKNLLEIEFFLN